MKLADFAPPVRQATPRAQAQSKVPAKAEQRHESPRESKGLKDDQSFKSSLREEAREDRSIRREEQEKAIENGASKAQEAPKKELAKDVETQQVPVEAKKKSQVKGLEENEAVNDHFELAKNVLLLNEDIDPEKLEELLAKLTELSQKEESSFEEVISVLSSVLTELKPKLAEFKEKALQLENGAEPKAEGQPTNLLIDLSSVDKSVKIHLVDNPAQTKVQVQVKEKSGLSDLIEQVKDALPKEPVIDQAGSVESKVLAEKVSGDTKPAPVDQLVTEVQDKGALNSETPIKTEASKVDVKLDEPVLETKKDLTVESNLENKLAVKDLANVSKNKVSEVAPNNMAEKALSKSAKNEVLDLPKDTSNKALPKQDLSKLQSEVKSFEFTVKKPQAQADQANSPLKRLAEAPQSVQTKHTLQQEGQNLGDDGAQAEEEGFKFEKELKHSFKQLRAILHRHSDHFPFAQGLSHGAKAMPKAVLPQSFARLQTQILDKLNQGLPKLVADQNMKMSLEVQNMDLGNVRITIEQSGNQLNINVQGDRALNQLLTQARNELQSQIKMDGFENLDLNMNFGDESKNPQEQQGNEDASRVTLAGEESEDVMSLFEQSSRRFFDHIAENAS